MTILTITPYQPGSPITYTSGDTAHGVLLIAASQQGICAVALGDASADLEAALQHDYPDTPLQHDDASARLREWLTLLQAYCQGQQRNLELPLHIVATPFQQRVWQALCAIPYGETRTYGELAHTLQQPGAARAVGHACASNPVSLVIPCHRAVQANGGAGGYRWGVQRKRALLAMEQHHAAASA
jgi:O-6-methylguanine DNA methyltransferase